MAETKETPKFDGISAQINLSPGSETHRRFAELMRETGSMTARSFVEMLMDAYTNPKSDPTVTEDIQKFHDHIDTLNAEIGNYQQQLHEYENQINDLQKQLETAQKEANDNAVNGLGKQSQIEFLQEQNAALQKKMEGAIIVHPNPVSRYFLDEMATKTGKDPSYILEKLYMDDLQNPRANNLPYTVTAADIRRVIAELKKEE